MKRVMDSDQIKEARILKKDGYSMRSIGRLLGLARSTVWDNVFRNKKKVTVHFTLEHLSKCEICEIYMTPEIDIKTRFIPMNYKINDTCLACYLKQKGVHYADVMSLLDYYGK